jgi:hypothetical protein
MRRTWVWLMSAWSLGHWGLAMMVAVLLQDATYYIQADGNLAPNCANGAEKGAVLGWAALFCSMVLGTLGGLGVSGRRWLFAVVFVVPFLAATGLAYYYNGLVPPCP